MARRRDHAAEYARRNKRARALGFPGEVARRKVPRHPGSAKDFGRLPERARSSRSSALSVVHRARADRISVEEAAAAAGVSMFVVEYWAGEALEPTRHGRTLPRADDPLLRLRPLILEGASETELVAVRGSNKAVEAAWIFDIQWRFVTGQANESELEQIHGFRVAGRTVESDPVRLARLAAAGAIDPGDAYRALLG